MWAWGASSIIGLLMFDLWRGTRASDYLRYALPALPAALVLLGMTIATAPRTVQLLLAVAIGAVWLHAFRVSVFTSEARPFQPLPEVARRLHKWRDTGATEPLVIVHSIPTGVIGLARYLDGNVEMFPSIIRVNNAPAPADIDRATAGYDRFAYVRFHDLGVASTYASWLSEHTQASGTEDIEGVQIRYFTRAPLLGAGR
jgi:hypothetical protein